VLAYGSVADVLIAAPVGFIVGILVGLLAASRYALVDRREWKVMPRREYRDRGDQ
jgi:hypothetical protein